MGPWMDVHGAIIVVQIVAPHGSSKCQQIVYCSDIDIKTKHRHLF